MPVMLALDSWIGRKTLPLPTPPKLGHTLGVMAPGLS
jgi:hypothetical protein